MNITSLMSLIDRALLPEYIILCTIIALGLSNLLPRAFRRQSWCAGLSLAGVLAAFVASVGQLSSVELNMAGGLFRLDGFTVGFELLLLISAGLILLLSMNQFQREQQTIRMYTLLMIALLGGLFIAVSAHLLVLIVAVEMMMIPAYLLVKYSRTATAEQSFLTYLSYGGIATLLIWFGVGLLFMITGEFNVYQMSQSFIQHFHATNTDHTVFIIIAFISLFIGIVLKLSLFPIKKWAVDTFAGHHHITAVFLNTVMKVAGIALILRVLIIGFESVRVTSGKVEPLLNNVTPYVTVIIAAVILLGHVFAWWQSNLQRRFVYAGIAQSGFALIPFMSLTTLTLSNAWFYMLAFLLFNIGVFTVIRQVTHTSGYQTVSALTGLYARSPLLALSMLVFLLASFGFPLTMGYIAKFDVFVEAYAAGHYGLVVMMVLAVFISALYYFKMLRDMFKATDEPLGHIRIPFNVWMVTFFCVGGLMLFGLFPNIVLDFIRQQLQLAEFYQVPKL